MAVQGHPRSLISVPIESACATSYQWSIATLVLSCRVSEILQASAENSHTTPIPFIFSRCSLRRRADVGLCGANTLHYLSVRLLSKLRNLYDHKSPTSFSGQTDNLRCQYRGMHSCTHVHREVKINYKLDYTWLFFTDFFVFDSLKTVAYETHTQTMIGRHRPYQTYPSKSTLTTARLGVSLLTHSYATQVFSLFSDCEGHLLL